MPAVEGALGKAVYCQYETGRFELSDNSKLCVM